jgi:hypothetical protein
VEYTKLLREAYQATWQHKRMWWLGMAILTGGSLGSNFVSNGLQIVGDSADTTELSDAIGQWWSDPAVQDWWADSWWILIVVGFLVLLFWIVALFTHLVAQSGLYHGANQARLGQPVKFGEMCKVGIQTTWNYVGFYLLFALGRAVAGLTWTVALVTLAASLIGLVLAVPLAGLSIFAWVAINIVLETFIIYCLQGMTLQRYSGTATFGFAWQLLRQNFLDSVLASILVMLLKLAIGLATLFLYLILILPFAILAYVAYTSQGWLMAGVSSIVGGVLILALWLVLKGMVQSFYTHLWHRIYASFTPELPG